LHNETQSIDLKLDVICIIQRTSIKIMKWIFLSLVFVYCVLSYCTNERWGYLKTKL